MTLSPVVAEWVAAYEQEHGRKPDVLVLQIAEHILKVGKVLTNRGQQDHKEGKAPYHADAFQELVIKAFRMDGNEDSETVQAVADLWRSDYLDGYQNIGSCEDGK